MITVNTHEAKTKLSALLVEVETRGETVRICRNGRPIAELRAASALMPADPLQTHAELGGQILYDPLEPADEQDWPEEAR